MYIFPAQFDSHRGPDVVGSHKLIFSIDESVKISFNPMDVKKGTEFMVALIPVSEEASQSEDVEGLRPGETMQQTEDRFRKRLHVMIGECSQYLDIKPTEVKDWLRNRLKVEGKIAASTKELDINGLSYAIYLIDQKINDITTRGQKTL